MASVFDKKAFADRLRALMKEQKITIERLAELTGLSTTMIKNYRDYKDSSIPKTDSLIFIAEVLNVSVDYLVGRDNARHIGNKEIKDITGLSEEAIEVLRGFTRSRYAFRNIQMINDILEEYYDHGSKNETTVLSNMYAYIHASDLIYAGDKDIDEMYDTVVVKEEALELPDHIAFFDKSIPGKTEIYYPERLYQASEMEQIQGYIIEKAKEYKEKVESAGNSPEKRLIDHINNFFEDCVKKWKSEEFSEGSEQNSSIAASKKSEEGSEADQAPDDKQIKKGRKSNE